MGTYLENRHWINTDTRKYSFHPSGRKPTVEAYVGFKRHLLTTNFYTHHGSDDNTGINSKAIGLRFEIGTDKTLKFKAPARLTEHFPAVKSLLDNLSLKLELNATASVERLYFIETGEHKLQISLEFEASAEIARDMQQYLLDKGAINPNLPIDINIEGTRNITCSATIPFTDELSLLVSNDGKRVDLATGLIKSCFQSIMHDPSDVSTHRLWGESIRSQLHEGWIFSSSRESTFTGETEIPDIVGDKVGTITNNVVSVKMVNGLIVMDHFPSSGTVIDSYLSKVEWGIETLNYNPEEGYRNFYIGENADIWNARQIETYAYLVLKDALNHHVYNPDSPKTQQEITDTIWKSINVYVQTLKKMNNATEAPPIVMEAVREIDKAVALFQTNPLAAMTMLNETQFNDPAL
ncbi:MAG: hypothetical protein P8179_16095 [Candidatus Thiodiazotropha sp.]